MVLSDNNTNTVDTFLYVRAFKWLDSNVHESTAGHPRSGIVYPAIKNTDTNTYRLIISQDQAILLPVLQVDDTDTMKFNYRAEIIEVTRKTVVPLQLPQSNLEAILNFKQPVQKLTPKQQQERHEFAKIGEALGLLMQSDPYTYKTVTDLIYGLQERNEELELPDDSTMSPVLGPGVNIGSAINLLRRYGSADRRQNLDTSDLMEAIKCIIDELNRVQHHGH